MFTINDQLKGFFETRQVPSEQTSFPRLAMTRSAGHGCINIRPVNVVTFYFPTEMTGRIEQIRGLFKTLITELTAKHYSLAVNELWKFELRYTLDDSSRTSLSFRSLRKWLYSTQQPVEVFNLIIAGISALEVAQNDEEFIQLLNGLGWNAQNFTDFNLIVSEFVRAKALECSQYFLSIMDQQRDHSAARFEEFIGVHQRFVSRIATRLPPLVRRGEMNKFTAEKAFKVYTEKQIELFTPRAYNAEPLTPEEEDEREHLKFYRGRPMVRHEQTEIKMHPPYGSGKGICEKAQKSFGRKVAVIDFSPKGQKFLLDNGLCQHFVKLQEAHVIPTSKIFSGFGYHLADSLGFEKNEVFKYMESLIGEFSHQSVYGNDFDRKLGDSIDRLLRGKDTPKIKFAKLFMMLEYISLLEASKTDHISAYYNQITDHLSESKTKHEDSAVPTDPLALRIVKGVHTLLEFKRAVAPSEVLNAHEEYIDSVKRACRDLLVERCITQFDAPRPTIKEALGLVGAFDHLLSVYRVEQMYLERISPLADFSHEDLFRLMEDWAITQAQKNEIVIN